tara:strand:- start:406 stop:1074 length:669 start_codon:yes stop_codon:yes gene_type:complete
MTERSFHPRSGTSRGRRARLALLTLAALLLPALSGCEGLLPGLSGPPPDLYTLTPKSNFDLALPRIEKQIVVEEPLASGGLNNTRIALRTKPIELQYFARSSWTERAPRMVQTLLVESFENTDRIVSVGRQAIGLRSDYNLKSELREFQAEYYEGAVTPLIRVRLNAKLVRQPRRNIVASQTFEAEVRAAGQDIDSIILAFDEALGKVLKRTVEWTLTSVEP